MSIKNFFSSNKEHNSSSSSDSGLLFKLKKSLQKTKTSFIEKLSNLCLGKKVIDAELLKNLEATLLSADLGVKVTNSIIQELPKKLERQELNDSNLLFTTIREQLECLLTNCETPLSIETIKQHSPFIIFMIGINGAGKTTTIGKLAHLLQNQGLRVMLAAGDTFRAAATEQLQTWGTRNNVPVISQHIGADSASVIFDAVKAAQSRQYDVLIADTAGRLHTKDHLLEELKKVLRVVKKLDPSAPHEVMLVLDASTGQNAIAQAEQFHQALGVTGITLTKLDGTAKGGVIFSIASNLQLPLRYIGVGEGLGDLKEFNAKEFISSMFDTGEL